MQGTICVAILPDAAEGSTSYLYYHASMLDGALQVRLQTRIFLPPDELYDLLTQPDNSKVFRNIKVRFTSSHRLYIPLRVLHYNVAK